MVTGKSNLVDVEVTVVHETEWALLVDHGGDGNVWLPKSACEIDSFGEPVRHICTLPESLAIDKGMV